MPSSDSEHPISQILAVGLAFGIGGAGILWGLSKLVPTLVISVALAIKTVTATTAAGLVAAPWVAPTMAVGVATLGTGTGYMVLVSIVEKAKKDIFTAILPVLSIWAGAVVDLSKELFGSEFEAQKALYSILAAALVMVSGILTERRQLLAKVSGGVVAIMPPIMFVVLLVVKHKSETALSALKELPILDATVLGMLTLTSIGVAVWGVSKSAE